MREQIIKGVNVWLGNIIDNIAPNNLLFALVSPSVKRVLGQYIDDNFNFELVKPFVIARKGELDVDTTMQEIMQGLKNMPKKKYNLNSLNIEIGEGVIIVNIPEHPALSMLTDNLRKITLKEKDFEDLIRNIKEQE
jgi:hypothetical protein